MIVVPFCCVRNPKREGLQETIFNKGRTSVAETIHSTFTPNPIGRALLKLNTFEYNSKYVTKNFNMVNRPLRYARKLFKTSLISKRLFSTISLTDTSNSAIPFMLFDSALRTEKRTTINIAPLNPWFITGLTDAEGCFMVDIIKKPNSRTN